jgi:hypothetical protein
MLDGVEDGGAAIVLDNATPCAVRSQEAANASSRCRSP